MNLFSIILLGVLAMVGTGGYRVYLWLADFLAAVISPRLSKHISFTVLGVAAAGLSYPFLVPQDNLIQIGVWCFYLGLAAIGAWHIFECIQRFRNGR
jgi:hypothetical protein